MRKMIFIASHGIRIWLTNSRTYIGLFIAPLMMVVVLGLGIGTLNTMPDRIRVDVIDHDHSALSTQFLSNLRAANATLVLCPFDNTRDDFCQMEGNATLTEERAVKRLASSTALALIEIPSGFENQLEVGKPVSIVYRANETADAPSYILQAVQSVTQRISGSLVAAKDGTFQRLVVLPITRSQILGGKILMYFTLGMMEFAIVFAMGLLLRVNFGRDLIALLLVMVTFTLCMTALTFALATLLRTEQQGYAVLLLLGQTLAPLGGAWWPLDVVPEFMRIVGHISPVAWAMDSFRLLIFENANLIHILPNLEVLLAMAAVFFAFAIWRFKYD